MLLFLDRVCLQYWESFKSPRLNEQITSMFSTLIYAFLHKKLQFHLLYP